MVKVLIADDLADGATDIFVNRGIEVDRKVGLKKDELIAIIDQYDGLAVRSACKPVRSPGSLAGRMANSARSR